MDWCPYRLFPHSVVSVVCGNDCLIKDARERMPWKRPKHVCQCLRQHSFVITSEISIVIFKRNPKITTRFIVSSAVLDSLSELWRGCLFSVHAPSTFCLTTALSHRYVPRQGPAVNDPHHGLTHSYDTCWVPFFAPQGQTSCLWGPLTHHWVCHLGVSVQMYLFHLLWYFLTQWLPPPKSIPSNPERSVVMCQDEYKFYRIFATSSGDSSIFHRSVVPSSKYEERLSKEFDLELWITTWSISNMWRRRLCLRSSSDTSWSTVNSSVTPDGMD